MTSQPRTTAAEATPPDSVGVEPPPLPTWEPALDAPDVPAASAPLDPDGTAVGGPSARASDAVTTLDAASVPSTPHERRSRAVPTLLSIAAAIALVGVAFSVGRMTAPAAASTTGVLGGGPAAFPGANGAGGVPNGGLGGFGGPGFDRDGGLGPAVSGSVQSVTADGLTVQLANGQTVTVATGSTTTYHSQASASRSDLASGQNVTIRLGLGAAGGTGGTTTATPSASDVTITSR